MISWPVPEPEIPDGTDAVLAQATRAAVTAFRDARANLDTDALSEEIGMGADGTPTTRLDELVETAIVEVASALRVNVLSEEAGSIDNGSAVTLAIDPVDGTANAVSGVPLAAFAGAIVVDGVATEALTCWLDTGRCWHARAGLPTSYRTNGRRELDGSSIGLQRPRAHYADSWWRVAERVSRVRILSTTCLESALVAEGAIDGFADPGGEAHRIVDLAAAMVTVPAAGGAVIDAYGRPLEIDTDLTRRWSGVVGATPELAEQLAEAIRG